LKEWIVPLEATRHWPAAVYDEANDQLYTHYQDATYYSHARVTPGIFSVRPTLTTTAAQGYPTATNIIMGTLRPVGNYKAAQQLPRPSLTIVTTNYDVDQWEFELLQRTMQLTDTLTIREQIRNGNIVSCSDGSVRDNTGSFGFIISSTQGQRLLKGRGPTPGAYSNSFRSEAYGVLAAMRWLQRAISEEIPPADMIVTHYLDNQSVIKCLDRIDWFSWKAPNTRLQPEQDVLDEIHTIVRSLPIRIEFKWIKGHQDLTTPYHTLSLPAQLNCDADQEADLYHHQAQRLQQQDNLHQHHHQTQQQYQQVTPLPSTPAQLIIQHQSVTKHLKRRVREAIAITRLQAYLKHKFQWDDTIFNCIDWQLYQQIIGKYTDQRTTIVKHLHVLSPTGHIAHRNDPNLPHECPACGVPFEDNAHVIKCLHPTRRIWRDNTTQKLFHYRPEESDPHLLDILRDGISRYHSNHPLPNPQQYPRRYHVLIRQQNSIGWDHLYRGRWCKEWDTLQTQYRQHQNHAPPTTISSTWTLGIGRLLIDQWLALWKLRNEQRHGVDQARHSRIREHALRHELQKLYTFKSQVCPIDNHIFQASAEAHLHHTPNLDHIETWIAVHKEAIQASAAMAKRLGITQNRTIREYLAFNPIALVREPPSLPAGGLPN
jgi:ribonuclease HI